jgi:hypothetical protein
MYKLAQSGPLAGAVRLDFCGCKPMGGHGYQGVGRGVATPKRGSRPDQGTDLLLYDMWLPGGGVTLATGTLEGWVRGGWARGARGVKVGC